MTDLKATGTPTRHLKPRITLTADDHERLSDLAKAATSSMPEVASYLSEELDRAQVLPAGRHADAFVQMGSELAFRDDGTGKIQRVTLVYPDKADIAQGKISILTPIGAALIGLRAGQSITWETRTGELRRLTVLDIAVTQPA